MAVRSGDITSIDHRHGCIPGLARTLFGGGAESVMWVLQFLMWLGSGALIYLSVQNATRSTILAMLGAGFFFFHPSPLLLTFHADGISNFLLISAFCWVLTCHAVALCAILLIALATTDRFIYYFLSCSCCRSLE
jgi:hypothetical protein